MSVPENIVVAIDGPAASGKSTTAKKVAEELKLLYIDTGAMYRAATLSLILSENISLPSKKQVAFLKTVHITQKYVQNQTKTYINGTDVSNKIRARKVTQYISSISSNPYIRNIMVSKQRDMGAHGNVILDGRDIGTVVFPNADYKFFIIADINSRAKRRFQEFQHAGEPVSFRQVLKELKERDKQDKNRKFSPLKKADDALLIDTSKKTIEEQASFIIRYIQRHKKGNT